MLRFSVLSIFLVLTFIYELNAQCDVGWARSSTVKNKCYRWFNVYKAYTDAERDCENQNPNATLITIGSAFENSEYFQAISSTGYDYWIGMNCIAQPFNWVWFGTEKVNYTNWSIGNPSNINGWYCAYMGNFQGNWWSWDCTIQKGYMCQYYLY